MHVKKEDEKEKKGLIFLTFHQLKAPISDIKLSLEMLLDGSFGKINEGQRDIVEKSRKKTVTLIYLLNDLLSMASLNEERYGHKTSVDIEELVKCVMDGRENEIKRKKIDLEFKKPESGLPKVMVNREKMFIAIQNLFDNAIKYTPPLGKISVCLEDGGGEIKMKIQDSGMGIPQSEQKKLFTKFFRAENAAKIDNMGSGLGLFITKEIVENHNGKIWFESKENEGSSFFISLPVPR